MLAQGLTPFVGLPVEVIVISHDLASAAARLVFILCLSTEETPLGRVGTRLREPRPHNGRASPVVVWTCLGV